MLFYGLDRFSTDLDFDIRESVENFDPERVDKIAKQYLEIKRRTDKQRTHFWHGVYNENSHGVKIEISKRDYPQRIVIKDYLGINLATMAPEKMFAHKLVAASERNKNRDLYDIHFMLEKNWDIDDEIISMRTGMHTKEYLRTLIVKVDENRDDLQSFILNDLGGMLTESRRTWVKNNLLDSLKTQLLIRVETMGE
jgi:predicted nucleotidyltransferase component of viral defense system